MKSFVDYISEMAYNQSKAIEIVNEGTSVVLEHWLKIQLMPDHKSINKWNLSIDKIFKKYSRIKLKGSKNPPSLANGVKWFFFEGDECQPEDISREISYIEKDYRRSFVVNESQLAEQFRSYVTERMKKELGWK